MTVYGYLRISTVKQNLDTNRAEILNLANEKDLGKVVWIQEQKSGRIDWRKRKLGEMFMTMAPGDVIIMSEFSRIGRDFEQSFEFLAEAKRKGIKIYSTCGDIPLDDEAISKLYLAIRAFQSQVERENISRRTKISMAERKAAGIKVGRPSKMLLENDVDGNIVTITNMLNNDIRNRTIAKELKCTPKTLSKFIKKYNIKPDTPIN